MSMSDDLSDPGSEDSGAFGGASPSSSGSSGPPGTAAAIEAPLSERVRAAREAKGLSRYKADKEAQLSPGTTKRIEEGTGGTGPEGMRRLGDLLGLDLAPAASPAAGPSEVRPSAAAKRKRGRPKLLGRRGGSRTAPDSLATPPSRPRVHRVSTAPVTEAILSFAGGGLERLGQGPLGRVAAFTAPVAGDIVDDAIEGTMLDRIAQPFVKGSEKYQNLSALVACYGSVAWASNYPEAADQAYALFYWSMTILLPIQGKQMLKRAKEQQKAAEALAEIMPDLEQLLPPELRGDPIRGLWAMMYAQPAQPPPAPAEESVPA